MKHIKRERPQKQPNSIPKRQQNSTYCAYCGAQIPTNHKDCVICGTARGQLPEHAAPERSDIMWSEKVGTTQGMYKSRRRLTVIAIIMVFVFVISGTGVAAFQYFSHQFTVTQYAAYNSVIYQTGSTLKINIPTLPQPITVSESFKDAGRLSAQTSHDRRFIAYLENRTTTNSAGTLKLLDLIRLDEGSPYLRESVAIMSDIVDYRFLPRSDRIFYLTSSGDLFLCDYSSLKNIFQMGERVYMTHLDSNVRGIGDIDNNFLLYYKGDFANTQTWNDNQQTETGTPFDLFIANFNSDDISPTQIAEDVYRVVDSTRDFERIIYTCRTRSAPLTLYDVFAFNRRENQSVQLVRSARHIVDANANSSKVFYLSPAEEVLTFKDLFDDDTAESDQLITEPLLEDFGLGSPEELEALDPAIVDARYELYDQAFQKYAKKLDRDQLRRELRTGLRDFLQNNYLSFELYYADSTEATLLADHIYNRGNDITALVDGNVETGMLVYSRGERDSLQRTVLSELSADDLQTLLQTKLDVIPYLSESMLEGLWYHKIGSEPVEIFLESGARYLDRYFLTNDSNGIYFSSMSTYNSGVGTLYYSSLSPTEAGQVVHVDEDVTDYIGIGGAPNVGLFYRKLTRGAPTMRDILIASAGSARVIATETLADTDAHLLGANNNVLAYYRMAEHQSPHQLYLYFDQEKFIGGSINDLALYDPETIYLLYGAGNSHELFLYSSGETTLLDQGINNFEFLALPN